MDIMELGAIGELIGALAVVATLGYLALQIRQSGQSSRQRGYHDLVTRRSDLYNKMVESEGFTAIAIAGFRGDAMNEVDAQRFTAWLLNYVSHIQDVHLQRQNGIVEEGVWRAERQFLAVARGLPGFVDWWQAASQYFLPEFIAEVETIEEIPVVVMDQETGRWIRGTW